MESAHVPPNQLVGPYGSSREGRDELLGGRARHWQEAVAIRRYCDAVEEGHSRDVVGLIPARPDWLAFARTHADQLQPGS